MTESPTSPDVAPAVPAIAADVQPLSLTVKIATLLAVILPFVGMVAAAISFWGWGFRWVELGLLLVLYVLTALGITVGYHRLFTHKSFETTPAVQFILGVLGSMAVQGPLLSWVALHRRHHQHSDGALDPHSPHQHGRGLAGLVRGLFHAHLGWLFMPEPRELWRYVKDLRKNRLLLWVSRLFPLWVVIGLVIPTVLGGLLTMTWLGAFLGLVWGGLARIFLVHHVTWSVNSICHVWGTRPFESGDESRNHFVVAVLSMGEGWHNNHHAFPTSARHGLKWWQIDTSYWVIQSLALVGLAWNIKVPRVAMA